ncbi:GNAT family acetyltransferase [uncultured Endozoicomonas sp.]|uniref:GNAT family acetyltransferase n=1 Tax=uncultured Endozoicomonas sp. TaxID=432652 RepID=UPI002639C8E7|nr:GNAT family acetyltransferase [uncultured Endozoicomonas sp.]
MEVVVRHAEQSDLKAIGELLSHPEVTRNTSQIPYRSQSYWDNMFDINDKNHIQLIAHSGNEVVGHLGLIINQNPRRKHCASFGITVRHNAQGKGVGKQLMTTMVDLADNWLSLTRIELDVYTDNHHAITLYERFGFEVEGESRFDTFQDGKLVNSFRMSRISPDYKSELSHPLPSRIKDQHLAIRNFDIADTESVINLWQQCNLTVPQNNPKKDIKRKVAINDGLFLVGLINGEIVASVMGGYEGHRGWVNYLAVCPQWQRNGFGRELMADLEKRLIAMDCPKINLQVRTSNQQVIAFYHSLGYKTDRVTSLGKRLID